MRYSLLLVLLSCTALTLAGCADETAANKAVKTSSLNGRQEVKLRLAHATEESGDYAGAEKLFIQVVAQAPGSIDANAELGDFYKRHHEDQKAIESLNAALKLDPRNTGIERSIANIYIGIGEPEKALAVLDQAIAINPKDPLLYNSKGVALDQIGSYKQAQNAYKMAYDLDTIGGTTYKVNISMSYILSGSYDKAIALLRPMLDTPDAPPIVRQNLALAYGMKGENDEALKLGLQDLSTSEAEENLRFYRMLAQKHLARVDKNSAASTAPVPASVVRELFPENEPEGRERRAYSRRLTACTSCAGCAQSCQCCNCYTCRQR